MPEVKGERRAYLELTHREHAEEKFAFLGVFQTVCVGKHLLPNTVLALDRFNVRIIIETVFHELT